GRTLDRSQQAIRAGEFKGSTRCATRASCHAGCSAPKYPVPPPLQHFRNDGFCPLRFLARGKPTNTYHQVVTKPQTEFVRFTGGELPALLVLCEAMFWRVSRLADIKRCQRAGSLRAGPGEFDDVDGVGAREWF